MTKIEVQIYEMEKDTFFEQDAYTFCWKFVKRLNPIYIN